MMGKGIQTGVYYVYKLYDKHDELQYVGFTKDWKQRRRDHKARKPWFSEVAREGLEPFADSLSAQLREVALIFDACPRYNRVGKVEDDSYTAFFLSEGDPEDRRAGEHISPGLLMRTAPIRAMRLAALAYGCKGVFCHLDCGDAGFCLRASITDTNLFEIPMVGQWPEPAPPRSWILKQEERERQRLEEERRREEEWRISPEGIAHAQKREQRQRAAAKGRETFRERMREEGRRAAQQGFSRTPPHNSWLGDANTYRNRLWLEGYDGAAAAQIDSATENL